MDNPSYNQVLKLQVETVAYPGMFEDEATLMSISETLIKEHDHSNTKILLFSKNLQRLYKGRPELLEKFQTIQRFASEQENLIENEDYEDSGIGILTVLQVSWGGQFVHWAALPRAQYPTPPTDVAPIAAPSITDFTATSPPLASTRASQEEPLKNKFVYVWMGKINQYFAARFPPPATLSIEDFTAWNRIPVVGLLRVILLANHFKSIRNCTSTKGQLPTSWRGIQVTRDLWEVFWKLVLYMMKPGSIRKLQRKFREIPEFQDLFKGRFKLESAFRLVDSMITANSPDEVLVTNADGSIETLTELCARFGKGRSAHTFLISEEMFGLLRRRVHSEPGKKSEFREPWKNWREQNDDDRLPAADYHAAATAAPTEVGDETGTPPHGHVSENGIADAQVEGGDVRGVEELDTERTITQVGGIEDSSEVVQGGEAAEQDGEDEEDGVAEESQEDEVVEKSQKDEVVEDIQEDEVVEEIQEDEVVKEIQEDQVVEESEEDQVVDIYKEDKAAQVGEDNNATEESEEDNAMEGNAFKESNAAEEDKEDEDEDDEHEDEDDEDDKDDKDDEYEGSEAEGIVGESYEADDGGGGPDEERESSGEEGADEAEEADDVEMTVESNTVIEPIVDQTDDAEEAGRASVAPGRELDRNQRRDGSVDACESDDEEERSVESLGEQDVATQRTWDEDPTIATQGLVNVVRDDEWAAIESNQDRDFQIEEHEAVQRDEGEDVESDLTENDDDEDGEDDHSGADEVGSDTISVARRPFGRDLEGFTQPVALLNHSHHSAFESSPPHPDNESAANDRWDETQKANMHRGDGSDPQNLMRSRWESDQVGNAGAHSRTAEAVLARYPSANQGLWNDEAYGLEARPFTGLTGNPFELLASDNNGLARTWSHLTYSFRPNDLDWRQSLQPNQPNDNLFDWELPAAELESGGIARDSNQIQHLDPVTNLHPGALNTGHSEDRQIWELSNVHQTSSITTPMGHDASSDTNALFDTSSVTTPPDSDINPLDGYSNSHVADVDFARFHINDPQSTVGSNQPFYDLGDAFSNEHEPIYSHPSNLVENEETAASYLEDAAAIYPHGEPGSVGPRSSPPAWPSGLSGANETNTAFPQIDDSLDFDMDDFIHQSPASSDGSQQFHGIPIHLDALDSPQTLFEINEHGPEIQSPPSPNGGTSRGKAQLLVLLTRKDETIWCPSPEDDVPRLLAYPLLKRGGETCCNPLLQIYKSRPADPGSFESPRDVIHCTWPQLRSRIENGFDVLNSILLVNEELNDAMEHDYASIVRAMGQDSPDEVIRLYPYQDLSTCRDFARCAAGNDPVVVLGFPSRRIPNLPALLHYKPWGLFYRLEMRSANYRQNWEDTRRSLHICSKQALLGPFIFDGGSYIRVLCGGIIAHLIPYTKEQMRRLVDDPEGFTPDQAPRHIRLEQSEGNSLVMTCHIVVLECLDETVFLEGIAWNERAIGRYLESSKDTHEYRDWLFRALPPDYVEVLERERDNDGRLPEEFCNSGAGLNKRQRLQT